METDEFCQSTDISLKEKYEIIEEVSKGQFGTVFRAINKENNEIVAIKKLYSSSKFNAQALREIKLMTQVNNENVLKLLDYKVKETNIKLVFEYMDYDLKNFIEHMPTPLKNSKVKGIAKQLLNGINAIHEKGILHRDLKPSNILINSSGVVKIGDFGSAISVDDTRDGQFEIEGFSRWYKSPEMLYGSRTYDQRSDIWSFACIFGELLNGSPLFPGINDFDQLSRIIKTIGNPTPKNWKDAESLPDYGKVVFHDHPAVPFEKLFPNATKSELDFISTVLSYERPKSIAEILNSPYFTENPKPSNYKLVAIKKEGNEIKPNYQAMFKF